MSYVPQQPALRAPVPPQANTNNYLYTLPPYTPNYCTSPLPGIPIQPNFVNNGSHTLDRVSTPLSTSVGSLTSSPTISSPNSSPRSPALLQTRSDGRPYFNEHTLDPLLKRRHSDDSEEELISFHRKHETDQKENSLTYNANKKEAPIIHNANDSGNQGFSQLDMLSYISMRATNETPAFLQSDHTYTVFQPLAEHGIGQLMDDCYGGRVVVSRKRKPLEIDFDSQITTPVAKKAKQTQGRPYSGEMVIDLIFPKNVDELYGYLCVKGSAPVAHRVKLQNSSYENSSTASQHHQQPLTSDGMPVFNNSQAMMQYFTGSSEFSIITAFRQSSMDKSAFKKGTCPVVKFNISPVYDYRIEYLKRMAYPRYKACMKMYVIPQVFKEAHTFYTSGAMYLQDQEARLANGMHMDLKSRIFHSKSWPDLPNSVYDKEFRHAAPKTKLNYILN